MKAPKKLLAVLAVFPLAAAAQAPAEPAKPAAPATPAIQLYGTLNVNLQWTKASGATTPVQSVPGRMAVSPDSSNLGIRGGYDVNEWLTGIYQCESAANPNGITTTDFCNRNSRLGVNGPWGTLFYGNWDTPFKAASYGTKADDPFLNTDVYGYQSIMSSPGFNYRSGGFKTATADAVGGFDVRAQNSVAYWTPKYMGLSGKAQWAVNEYAGVTPPTPGAPILNPQLFGAVINYDNGPLSVFGSWERHDDAFGLSTMNGTTRAFGATAANNTTTASKDQAWRVGAGYQLDSQFGATTASGMYEYLYFTSSTLTAGAIREYKRQAFSVALKHRWGDHELRGSYSWADNGTCTLEGPAACNTGGYGAQEWRAGYAYYLTKTLQTYVSWAYLQNKKNGQYTFTIGGAPAVAGATPKGADPMAVGLGLRLAF